MSVDPEWAAGVQALHAEAGGNKAGTLLSCQVVRPTDRLGLLAYALAGNDEAIQLLHAADDAIKRIETAPKRRRMLCGCCPRVLRDKRYAVVVVRAAREDCRQGITLAICQHCASGKAAVEAKAVIALTRIWPDLRQINVAPTAGRA